MKICVFGGLVVVVGSGGGVWMCVVICVEIRVLLKIIIFFRKSRKKVVFLQSLFRSKTEGDGEMPEWSIGAVSKTVDPLWGSQGSNPCLSARRN